MVNRFDSGTVKVYVLEDRVSDRSDFDIDRSGSVCDRILIAVLNIVVTSELTLILDRDL